MVAGRDYRLLSCYWLLQEDAFGSLCRGASRLEYNITYCLIIYMYLYDSTTNNNNIINNNILVVWWYMYIFGPLHVRVKVPVCCCLILLVRYKYYY